MRLLKARKMLAGGEHPGRLFPVCRFQAPLSVPTPTPGDGAAAAILVNDFARRQSGNVCAALVPSLSRRPLTNRCRYRPIGMPKTR